MNHVESVKQIYSAFQRGDIPTILGHLRSDIEWEYETLDHGIPWLKPGQGRDHVASFFTRLGQIELNQFDLVSLLEGPAMVAAIFRIALRVKATDCSVRDLEVHLWNFDEQGQVSRFRHVVDTRQHAAALAGQTALTD